MNTIGYIIAGIIVIGGIFLAVKATQNVLKGGGTEQERRIRRQRRKSR